MGALSRTFEDAGLPTTQISLIRMHTERMRPPRALWVPFILGRPLGRPDDADFQRRVLDRALGLFEHPSGPVLVDHDEEAGGDVDLTGLACPISWAPEDGDGSLAQRLDDEIAGLRVWFDLASERAGRTAFGTAGLPIEDVVAAMLLLAEGGSPDIPDDRHLGDHARLVAEDLKTFVTEAAGAQPGEMSAFALKAWFWEQTAAGEAILAAYRAGPTHPDDSFRNLALAMVPAELR